MRIERFSGITAIRASLTCAALSLVLFFPCFSPSAQGQGARGGIGGAFAGEELVYTIGFWFFDEVAQGRVTLRQDGPSSYTATLTAHTTGLVDTLLNHRRDKYVARLRTTGDNGRFLTESFEKTVEMDGKEARRSLHTVDYAKREVRWRSWGGGKDEKTGVAAIPEGMYIDDPIAAFYNFRFGVYGDIAQGREYSIASFPRDERFPEIQIRLVSEKELRKRASADPSAEYLADAKIDKDLFGSKKGEIEILFTRQMLPVRAVAKGILFFGDVRGSLSEVNLSEAAQERAAAR